MNIQLIDTPDDTIDPINVEQQLSNLQKWLNGLGDWCLSILPNLIISLVIFIAGWWAIKLIMKIMNRALEKSNVDRSVYSFLDSVVKTVLWIFLGICILAEMGVNVSTLIAGVSAAAVTIGLALKDSLSNVASGTLIIINRKFKTGDFIETEGIIGEVIKIEMMYTTLRTYDYKEVMIPNSRLTTNNIINHFTFEARRLEIPVAISYGQDYDRARDVIMKVLADDERILDDRPNKVIIDTFAESGVDLLVWFWCRSDLYWPVLFDTKVNIKKALDEAGIEIPFNQLDVHFDGDFNKKLDALSGNKGDKSI